MARKKLFSELLYTQVLIGAIPVILLINNAEAVIREQIRQSGEIPEYIELETYGYAILLIGAEALACIILAVIIRRRMEKRLGNHLILSTICAAIILLIFGFIYLIAKMMDLPKI